LVLEKQAALKPVAEQTPLLKQAFEDYLNVALGTNLRGTEQGSPFWVAKAGLEAIRLAEAFGDWPQVVKLSQHLGKSFPSLKGKLEKKIAHAQEKLTPEKN
jgi:hypothetical protein